MATHGSRRTKSARDRVLDNIKPVDLGYILDGEPSKCWLWQGETDRDGYGKIKHEGKYIPPHWTLMGNVRNGYRPPKVDGEEMEVDHLCKQRLCVRPKHLEYVTRLINMQRMHEDRRNAKDDLLQ
jgi:hypothetical protein